MGFLKYERKSVLFSRYFAKKIETIYHAPIIWPQMYINHSSWMDTRHWKQPDRVQNDEVRGSNKSILNWVYFRIFLLSKWKVFHFIRTNSSSICWMNLVLVKFVIVNAMLETTVSVFGYKVIGCITTWFTRIFYRRPFVFSRIQIGVQCVSGDARIETRVIVG